MLIALLGPACSGKSTLASHLVDTLTFKRVHVGHPPLTDRSNDSLFFASSSAFLDYATQHYQEDFVTTDLTDGVKLAEFAKRPFVAIVGVEAPVGVRFSRAVARAKEEGVTPPSLEEFVYADDVNIYGVTPSPTPISAPEPLTNAGPSSTPQKSLTTPATTHSLPSPTPSPTLTRTAAPLSSQPHTTTAIPPPTPLATLLQSTHLTLSNPHSTLPPFLSQLSIPSLHALLRPPWDSYFMRLATLASLRSNCMKRRVGAVLVREKRVVSTGYNGTPRGVRNCNEGGCGRCNAANSVGVALDECLCLHAEENALIEAGRERVSGGGAPGAVLYCNTCPCLRCTVKIVQSGVTEVVYSLSYSMDDASRRVLEEAGVVLRQMELPDVGLD
ncbi:dCMP deaminase [Pseudohyphozyma bogoriensis]|nr:dCMP deaminase [Pseudohyphozyma bogoriensis]